MEIRKKGDAKDLFVDGHFMYILGENSECSGISYIFFYKCLYEWQQTWFYDGLLHSNMVKHGYTLTLHSTSLAYLLYLNHLEIMDCMHTWNTTKIFYNDRLYGASNCT